MGASKKEEVNKEAAVGFKLPAVLYPAENSLSTKTKLPKVTENVNAEDTKEEKTKDKKGIIQSLIDGSKSVPKIVEAAGFITLGNIFYLAGGDKGFDLYMRSSRTVFNLLWGGSIFSNDKTLANITDDEIQKTLNPLHHLSQVVEPVLSPLHQGAAAVTDKLTYYGYNVYLSAQGSATIDYHEYAYRKTKEEYWELRAGENTLYALETLGIAYLMVTRGGILKVLGGKTGGTSALLTEGFEMAKLLRMPTMMAGLSSVGELLQQKEDPEKPLISLETLSVLIPMLIKGTFDSTVFMGALASISRPLMGLTSWRFTSVAKRDLEIWQKTIGSNNGAALEALPKSVLELPKKIAKVGKAIEFGNEAVDFTEGLPDFYQQAGNVKSRLIELAFNPFEKERWRFLGGSLMQFTSSALDLVDGKKSGQHKRVTEIGNNSIKPITESLEDRAIQTDEGYLAFTRDERTIAEKLNNPSLVQSLEKLGGAVLSENARVLYLQDREAVQAFYRSRAKEIEDRSNEELFSLRGIKSLFFGQATKQIETQSKEIENYYDRELKVTVAILPGENQTESQRISNLAIETHEAVHKRVAALGLEQVLAEEPVLANIIQLEMGIDVNQYLETPQKRIQLEEMLAYLTEYQILKNYGLKNINSFEADLSFFQSENEFSSNNHYQNIRDFVIDNYLEKVLSNDYQQLLLAAKKKKVALLSQRQIAEEITKILRKDIFGKIKEDRHDVINDLLEKYNSERTAQDLIDEILNILADVGAAERRTNLIEQWDFTAAEVDDMEVWLACFFGDLDKVPEGKEKLKRIFLNELLEGKTAEEIRLYHFLQEQVTNYSIPEISRMLAREGFEVESESALYKRFNDWGISIEAAFSREIMISVETWESSKDQHPGIRTVLEMLERTSRISRENNIVTVSLTELLQALTESKVSAQETVLNLGISGEQAIEFHLHYINFRNRGVKWDRTFEFRDENRAEQQILEILQGEDKSCAEIAGELNRLAYTIVSDPDYRTEASVAAKIYHIRCENGEVVSRDSSSTQVATWEDQQRLWLTSVLGTTSGFMSRFAKNLKRISLRIKIADLPEVSVSDAEEMESKSTGILTLFKVPPEFLNYEPFKKRLVVIREQNAKFKLPPFTTCTNEYFVA